MQWRVFHAPAVVGAGVNDVGDNIWIASCPCGWRESQGDLDEAVREHRLSYVTAHHTYLEALRTGNGRHFEVTCARCGNVAVKDTIEEATQAWLVHEGETRVR